MAVPAFLLFGQAVSGVASAALEIDAAKQEAEALEFQAKNEATNARIRNANRTQRLLQIIAANNAAVGARGIASTGSPQTIMQEDIRRASKVARMDFMGARSNQLSLRARAAATRRAGTLGAAASLLGTGVDIATTGFERK